MTTNSMTAATNEIVEMFESCSMTPEQISMDTGYEVESVKATLIQFSRVYRKVLEAKKNTDVANKLVSDDELEEAHEIVKDVMRFSKNEGIKFKAACRIIDEGKGRLDKLSEVKGAAINITVFNQHLIRAREAREKALKIIVGQSNISEESTEEDSNAHVLLLKESAAVAA